MIISTMIELILLYACIFWSELFTSLILTKFKQPSKYESLQNAVVHTVMLIYY